MKELELLKQDWNKDKSNEFRRYSDQELLLMTKRKTISISHRAFVIGIAEVVLWKSINYLLPNSPYKSYPYFINTLFKGLDMIDNYISYIFIATLLYLYLQIKSTVGTETLMNRIILTKKTIKWYIVAILFELFLEFSLITSSLFLESDKYSISHIMVSILIMIAAISVVYLTLKIIYYRFYGKLLYDLEKNHLELSLDTTCHQ